jgi:hypothetical protein
MVLRAVDRVLPTRSLALLGTSPTRCAIRRRATSSSKAVAARLVSDVGDAIRETGTGFDGLPQLRELFEQAALGVDELAETISRRSLGEMYDEVHAAVRQRPALANTAAVLAGFALFRARRTPEVRPVPRSRAVVLVDVLPTPDL